MDKASIIRNSITMKQVAEHYGFNVDERGFISCPFHSDKTSSLKIYSGIRGFSCFGCNTSGSVIDFTMKLFSIDFKESIARIDSDFCLRLTNEKPSTQYINEYKKKQQEKKRYEAKMKLIEEWWILEFKRTYKALNQEKPKQKFEELTDGFIKALCEIPYIEEKLSEMGVKTCER
jgi:DNA primase